MKNKLLFWLVTVGYSHRLPFLRGTLGTFGATLCYLLIYYTFNIQQWHNYLCASLALIFTIVSYFVEPWAQDYFKNDDPPQFIIDEWAGFFATLLFLPLQVNWIIYGFIAFRFFDMFKPFPLKRMEKIRGGIVWDDLGAAVYANLTLQVILYLIK